MTQQAMSFTSLEAGRSITQETRSEQHEAILRTLRMHRDGLVEESITLWAKLNPNSTRFRLGELLAAGKIVRTKETRRTRSGRKAFVWRLVSEGR